MILADEVYQDFFCTHQEKAGKKSTCVSYFSICCICFHDFSSVSFLGIACFLGYFFWKHTAQDNIFREDREFVSFRPPFKHPSPEVVGPLPVTEHVISRVTLQGTNISPKNGILKMIFLFPRWDMLVPWRV